MKLGGTMTIYTMNQLDEIRRRHRKTESKDMTFYEALAISTFFMFVIIIIEIYR